MSQMPLEVWGVVLAPLSLQYVFRTFLSCKELHAQLINLVRLLHELDLSMLGTYRQLPTLLANLTRARRLTLPKTTLLQGPAMTAIRNCRHLRVLVLPPKASGDQMIEFCKHGLPNLPKLTRLEIPKAEDSELWLQEFANQAPPSISYLNLEGLAQWPSDQTNSDNSRLVLEPILQLTNLEGLDLHRDVGDQGDGRFTYSPGFLSSLANLPKLNYLDVSNSILPTHAIRALTQLTHIALVSVRSSGYVFQEAMEIVRTFPKLRHLTLRIVSEPPWHVGGLRDSLVVLTELEFLDCRGFLLPDDQDWRTILDHHTSLKTLKINLNDEKHAPAIQERWKNIDADISVYKEPTDFA